VTQRAVSLVVLILVIALTWGCESYELYHFRLSKPGTSADYWDRLCGVELAPTHFAEFSMMAGTLPSVDGAAYYYDQLHHFQVLYSVPESSVLRDAAAVRAALALTAPPPEHILPPPEADSRHLFCRSAFDNLGIPSSADDLRRFRDWAKLEDASEFERRIAVGRHFGAIGAGETLYLTAWWAFVFLTSLAPRLRLSWRWRVTLAPLLLLLPFFLGYAPMSLTFGPGGGFVYPGYVMLASTAMSPIPCTPADRFVLHLLPRPLVAWSLLPGPAMAWSSLTCAGPVQALLAGAALAALLSALVLLSRRLKSWRSARSRAPL
jgi:hypothetical protein